MLEFDGLTRHFGDVIALDGLSFTVPTGQVFGFLGPNGAGKTTAMRAVFELIALDAGAVRWKGAAITARDRQRFGYMPEERGLYPGMVVVEQIEYLARLHGVEGAPTPGRRRCGGSSWAWPSGPRTSSKPCRSGTSSACNWRRPSCTSPKAHLVLDEPLSGLDPVGVDAISAVLVEEAAAGRGVLFSSHQIDLVEDLCHSVAIIDHGRLVAAGTVEELTARGKKAGSW